MITPPRRLSRSGLALVLCVCAAAGAGAAAPGLSQTAVTPHASVVVIVNTKNVTTQLSVGDLRRILLGEMTRWPSGGQITIAMRPTGEPERAAVLKLICGMTDADFARYLLQSAYRGETQSGIKLLDTPTGVRRFVFNVPGAIGFVRGDEIDASVKVLGISGAAPKGPAFGLTLLTK
jgi:ABC-type phosphate transport system substrate-binding protein